MDYNNLSKIEALPKKRKKAKIKKVFLSHKKRERSKVKELNTLLKGSINGTIDVIKSSNFNSEEKLRKDILELCDRNIIRSDKMWA